MRATGMIFRRFTVGSYPISGYLIADEQTRIGGFIDSGGFVDAIDVFIREHEIQLRHLLFTHGHDDHTEGLGEFSSRYSVQCWAGKGEVRAASRVLCGGERIEIGDLKVTALSTPGHTPGGISYYCTDRVFTGDALFSGSVGGTADAGQARTQTDAVRKSIFTLPDETLVFPAHGPASTVGAEKYGNPFFSSKSERLDDESGS